MATEEDGGSITMLLGGLKAGDPNALPGLWDRYFERLVDLARWKLRARPQGAVSDEEDVALQVLDTFQRGVKRGKFPRLDDRNDLWRLLVVMTARAVTDVRLKQTRLKRGEGRTIEASALNAMALSDQDLLDQVATSEPTPEFALMMAEEVRRLLESLRREDLRTVAIAKLEGETNEEVAARLGCSVRTVANKLKMIRLMWTLK